VSAKIGIKRNTGSAFGRNNLLQKKPWTRRSSRPRLGDYTGEAAIVTDLFRAHLDERQLWAMFGIAEHAAGIISDCFFIRQL
jgi:hypothetical protein